MPKNLNSWNQASASSECGCPETACLASGCSDSGCSESDSDPEFARTESVAKLAELRATASATVAASVARAEYPGSASVASVDPMRTAWFAHGARCPRRSDRGRLPGWLEKREIESLFSHVPPGAIRARRE